MAEARDLSRCGLCKDPVLGEASTPQGALGTGQFSVDDSTQISSQTTELFLTLVFNFIFRLIHFTAACVRCEAGVTARSFSSAGPDCPIALFKLSSVSCMVLWLL